jgi:hypothetical protein
MALEILAAIVAAIAMAGIALMLRKLSGQRLPKWIIPVFAGAGLLGFTVWSEYDWFSRVSSELPPDVIVVTAEKESSPLRPWSYLAPMTTAFIAMDTAATIVHPDAPMLRLVRLYSIVRWRGATQGLMIVDCANARQVLVTDGVEVTPDGDLTGGTWLAAEPDDAIQQSACSEG